MITLRYHNRARPGLDQALAAVREGDVLVVPKLDRLARSVPDARAIADQLEKKGVKLALGMSIYDPTDPMGKMFFNILATFAEFEADLIRLRSTSVTASSDGQFFPADRQGESVRGKGKTAPHPICATKPLIWRMPIGCMKTRDI